MACAQIEGSWPKPTLRTDGGVVSEDPLLIITPTGTSGVFTGRFQAAGEQNFEVRCTDRGTHSEVSFTRTHPDGTATEYTAIHLHIRTKRERDLFVGRFKRTTSQRTAGVEVGDWETEKPT